MLKKDTSCGFIVERIGWGLSGGEYFQNRYRFQSGKLQGPTLDENHYKQLLQGQESIPVVVIRDEGKTWWMFKGRFYWEDEDYTVGQLRLGVLELERSGEKFNEKIDNDFLNSLSIDDVKAIISIRNQIIEDLYKDAKEEYDNWVFKGKSAIEQAAKELLKPGEDIHKLEKFIGKIPVDFLGKGTFESSPVYRNWSARIEEAVRKLENANKILRAKARETFGFPDIPEEQEESALTDEKEQTNGRREVIRDDVKMYVWKRDGGGCVKCGSQEKLEFDHIIPVSKGGSNTARNIQLLCESCNRSKGDSIV